jgi:glycosyltransferase 2 family protein
MFSSVFGRLVLFVRPKEGRGCGGNLVETAVPIRRRASAVEPVNPRIARVRERMSGAALSWTGLGISALFAYLAVRHVDFQSVWRGLRASNYWWLVPAFAMLAAAIWLKATRWRYMFARDTRPAERPVVAALLIGYFFNSVLPARAGEAARVLALNRRAGTSVAEASATVVLERAYDILCLLLLLFVALPWLPSISWLHAAAALGIIVAAGLAASIVMLAVWGIRPIHFALRPLRRLPFLAGDRIEHIGDRIGEGLAAARQPRLVAAALALTTIGWLALALSAWFVMDGFHLGLPFAAALLVVVATNIAQILPSSPAAVGVFEAATLVALKPYHVSDSRALSYALVLHALNFLPYIVAGPILLRQTLALRSLSQAGTARTLDP